MSQDERYSTLRLIATFYKVMVFVVAGVTIVSAIGMVLKDTFTILTGVSLLLAAVIGGIIMFTIAELMELFISNEQGIRKTNEQLRETNKLLSELLDRTGDENE